MNRYLVTMLVFFLYGSLSAQDARKGNLDEVENKKTVLEQVQKLRDRKTIADNQSSQIKGSIAIAGCHEVVPEFRIFFNGMHAVSDREGYFSFPIDETTDLKNLSIIFCKNIAPQFEKNHTIKALGVHQGKRNQHFTLSKDEYDRWQWSEGQTLDETKSIPHGTMIVLIDPKYVDRLEQWPVKIPGNLIQFPRIVLKGDCELELKRASVKSLLYTLDATPYHEPITERVKADANGMKRLSVR
jgi:hypothetical protein